GAPTSAALRRYLGQELPHYMVPAAFVRLDALPRNANGKLDRNALPSPVPAEIERAGGSVDPRPGTEQRLAAIWADVLGVERVGATDDFFSLGGHSLKATRFLGRIADVFGVELSHRCFFDAPTVAEMATRIGKLRASASPSPHPASAPRT